MQQLLAAFFAFVLSFGHSGSTHLNHPIAQADDASPIAIDYVPNRHEIEQGTYRSSYAEMACTSCRTMNVTFRAH